MTEYIAPPTRSERLDWLKTKHRPTKAEWYIVQKAAHRIAEYWRLKGEGEKEFKGETAWQVIEAHEPDSKRSIVLMHLAIAQQAVWSEDDELGRGFLVAPERVRRVRSLRRQGRSYSSIASMTNLGETTVQKILRGETHRSVA